MAKGGGTYEYLDASCLSSVKLTAVDDGGASNEDLPRVQEEEVHDSVGNGGLAAPAFIDVESMTLYEKD